MVKSRKSYEVLSVVEKGIARGNSKSEKGFGECRGTKVCAAPVLLLR